MGQVNITRKKGALKRVQPTEDAVVCIVLSGAAVVGKIQLGEARVLTSTNDLETLGITAGNNPLAFKEIMEFYSVAGEGAELNIMLISDATSMTDICNKVNQHAKKLLDAVEGRGVILLVNRKVPAGYSATITAGLDNDVNTAVTKLQELGQAFLAENIPFVGILPALGWTTAGLAAMPARSTMSNDLVALNAWCSANDGLISQGLLGGWLAKHQVHQNIARVRSGKVADAAFLPDGTTGVSQKYNWATMLLKGLIAPVKINGKSGYFFNDDPCLTAVSSDYSSISWNRTINKAHRIAAAKLVENLNDDFDKDENTGKMAPAVASDWESDVENEIRGQMVLVGGAKRKEISGVKCTVDPDSDVNNDQVDASLDIVRQGQSKTINLQIGYAVSI